MFMIQDLRDYLLSIGFPTVFLAEMPEKPDSAIVLTETGGQSPVQTMTPFGNGAQFAVKRFQVRVRADNYATANTNMGSLYSSLSGLTNKTINGRVYMYFKAVQTPYYLGLDDAARPVIAVNFDVWGPEL